METIVIEREASKGDGGIGIPVHNVMDKTLRVFRRLRRPLHGFTLVELLVVISIIALLLAILIPSLQTARERAKQVMCLSNLHSFGLAITMYSTNNGGKWPSMIDPYRESYGDPEYWTSSIVASCWATPIWRGLGQLYQQKYIGTKNPYFCPNEKNENVPRYKALNWNVESDVRNSGIDIYGSYCIRGLAQFGSSSTSAANRLLMNVSKNPLVSCWFLYGPIYSYPGDFNLKVQGHHKTSGRYRYPLLFGDGHCLNVREYSFVRTTTATRIAGTPVYQNRVWQDFERNF